MSTLSLAQMKSYLGRSISSLNQNKLHGLMAEIDFRNHLSELGFQDRVSRGGWILRSTGDGVFGHNTIALFPETLIPESSYPEDRQFPIPPPGLHTICSTFHQLGIHSFFCAPTICSEQIRWSFKQLGIPSEREYSEFPLSVGGFQRRERRYNFLRYHTDVSGIPESTIPEEFSKENLRVTFQEHFLAEISDIDGILWGNRYTYPIEIKEKTHADDRSLGLYFGLDLGPFVKLAYYAAKQGNLHSIFVVKEIDNTRERNLVDWWFITFEHLAQFASWVPAGGGRNMQGGTSTVVKIPKCEFQRLNADTLRSL